jgi:hypothetical protein
MHCNETGESAAAVTLQWCRRCCSCSCSCCRCWHLGAGRRHRILLNMSHLHQLVQAAVIFHPESCLTFLWTFPAVRSLLPEQAVT